MLDSFHMELSERCIQTLEKEGWSSVYEWSEAPGTEYPEHSHQVHTAIIITEGSMSISMNGETKELQVGDRIEIPPHSVHSVVVGSAGCQFVVGERPPTPS